MNIFNIGKIPETSYVFKKDRQKEIEWRNLLGHELKLMRHIVIYQNTLRSSGYLATWEMLKDTETWWWMAKSLTGEEIRKYRAWWNLLVDSDFSQEGNEGVIAFILMGVARHRVEESGSIYKGPPLEKLASLLKVPMVAAHNLDTLIQSSWKDLMVGRKFDRLVEAI